MKIAIGTWNANAKHWVFKVRAPGFEADYTFKATEGATGNQPVGEFFWHGQKAGAVFDAVSQKTGTPYKRGNLESPILPGGKIYVSIFRGGEGREKELDLTWQPPRPPREGAAPSTPPPAGGHSETYAASAQPEEEGDIPF